MLSFIFNHVRNNKGFFVPYVLFLGIGAAWLFLMRHGSFFLEINQGHNSGMDITMPLITYLGDGWTIAILAVALAFVKYKYTAVLAFSALLTTIVVQSSKMIFSEIQRPSKYFQDLDLHLIEGVDLHAMMSFPSGHTTTAFMVCTVLMLSFNKGSGFSFLLFLIAFSTGFSRIYLAQHFLIDVYVGSIVGVSAVFLVSYLFSKYVPSHKYKWTQKSFLRT